MTARRPKRENRIAVPQPQVPMGGGGAKQATDAGATIRPFLVSGGLPYFLGLESLFPGFNPVESGTQLLNHLYVPQGHMGFIKQLRVGPYKPSVLQDPWETSGIAANSASWRFIDRTEVLIPADNRFPEAFGIWRTPMGWENYWNDDSSVRPAWRWSLRYFQGDIFKLRAQQSNIPPFNPADPLSFYLVPEIPVPTADAYPQGLPGDAPGPSFNAQRMQHVPESPLLTHLVVPPDTTILLFAQWEQDIIDPNLGETPITTGYIGGTGPIDYSGLNTRYQFPLFPSYGELHGYVQAISGRSNAALDNVELGW